MGERVLPTSRVEDAGLSGTLQCSSRDLRSWSCRVRQRLAISARRGEVRLSTCAVFRAAPVWAMWLVLAAYVGGLVLHDHLSSVLVDSWLGLATSWLPVVVCWLAVSRVGLHRRVAVLVSAAMTANAVGDTWLQASVVSVPFPSLADAVYLLFDGLMVIWSALSGQ
jgi:hypothetical protein